MTSPVTASDIKAAMKASIEQGMVATEPVPAPASSRAVPTDYPPSSDKRFTVVLTNSQHRFVKRFAVDHNSDASTITRMLFAMLESDQALAERVQERIRESWMQ
jgi:hypothetical protein